MLQHRAAVVGALVTGFSPAMACASEITALVRTEITIEQQSQRAPAEPPSNAQPAGLRPGGGTPGLRPGRYTLLPPLPDHDSRDATEAPASAPETYRYGYDRAATRRSRLDDYRDGLKLAPSSVMLRTGWNWSGRIGPMRWLGPLDGESGEFMLSLRRVPGAPRIQGVGKFHVGIHYTFE